MFKSLSPGLVSKIIVGLSALAVLSTVLIGGAWSLYRAGYSAGESDVVAAQLQVSLAAEKSLNNRQNKALKEASEQNVAIAVLWDREAASVVGLIRSLGDEVRELPRIQEMGCAPGSGRVDLVNRTIRD